MDSKVMIGVSTFEMGRYAAFHDYLNLLTKDEGTIQMTVHGQSPAKGRNLIFEAALEHDCTHVLLLDDDMTFAPDILQKLLKHDVDIVMGYYLMRTYPHQGLIFKEAQSNGYCKWHEVGDEETGLIEVKGGGFGCVLIKTSILEKLEKPWVRLGELESDGWCDDLGFYKRVREADIKIHMDLDVLCGHISNVIVAPLLKDGKWHVSYNTFGNDSIVFPMIRRPSNA